VASGTIAGVFVGRLEGVITREIPASTKSLSFCLTGQSVISQRTEVHDPNVCERSSIYLATIARGNPFEDRCEPPGIMNFLRWTPDRNARLFTILALIVILLIFGVAVIYSPDFQWRNANSGFGPDWGLYLISAA
jgi:hypothetical protein